MFFKDFANLGSRFIAGGDYNAKHLWWGYRLPTPKPRGPQLYADMQADNLAPMSTGDLPTGLQIPRNYPIF